jgi:RNA polymerase sigma factor (sigma-70 family)
VGEEQMTDRLEIERLYRDHGDRLWWSLLGYTGDRDVASDAAAEAFAQALGTRTTIFDPAGWVWRVAFRIATAELRNGHRRSSASPDGSYEIDDRPLQVMLALQELSAHQRAAFVLFYLDDRTTAQVADVLGIAPATVSVHLHRARRRLRAILGVDDG